MNLMAIANAEYRFMLVDIGRYGSQADGGVWRTSRMGQMYNAQELNIPLGRRLPNFGEEGPVPFFLAADEAFPLQSNMMRLFAGRERSEKEKAQEALIAADTENKFQQKKTRELTECQMVLNYRLSRARRIIENTLGILVHRFRVLLHPMALRKPEHAEKVIKACVCLHNYLTKEVVSVASVLAHLSQAHCGETQCSKCEREETEHLDNECLAKLHALPGQRFKDEAHAVRELLADYINGPGAVEWQWEYAGAAVVVSTTHAKLRQKTHEHTHKSNFMHWSLCHI